MKLSERFEALDFALYHLHFIGIRIKKTFLEFSNALDIMGIEHARTLYISSLSETLILTGSFMDEYHHHLNSEDKEVMEQIKMIKRIVKPAVKQIQEWKGIKDFRNHVLAHNLRKGERGESIFIDGLEVYDIPQSEVELFVLQACVGFITDKITESFDSRLMAFQQALDQEERVKREPKFKNKEEAGAAIDRVKSRINDNIIKERDFAGL